MACNSDLSAATARSLFDYDAQTGELTWKVSPSIGVKSGRSAGAVNSSGHLQVKIKGKAFSVHRVVWLITHGEWPPTQIDHINRNPADNRLANLRLATHIENCRNRGAQKNNTSGAKGVRRRGKRYTAQLRVNGANVFLGGFPSLEEASRAYQLAAQKQFGSFSAD
jgi:hypothetical protein